MFHEYSSFDGPSDVNGLNLHTIWKVNADSNYDIRAEFSRSTSRQLHYQGGRGLVAIRSHQGKGEIKIKKNPAVDLVANTLILVEFSEIERYRCVGESWNFWWFEFSMTGALRFPLKEVMNVPLIQGELRRFEEIFVLLRRNDYSQRCVAAADFNLMLYQYLSHWQQRYYDIIHYREIQAVIDLMHQKLDNNWRVVEMAAAAHMSERTFRRVFHQLTGKAPKRFYDSLRINLARKLLERGVENVQQVAGRLGYSSPFHLSKNFHATFGIAPSQIKKEI